MVLWKATVQCWGHAHPAPHREPVRGRTTWPTQVDKAIVHFGAADAKAAGNEYDLVFDESIQIDFVMEHTLAGDSQNKQQAEAAVITEAERKSMDYSRTCESGGLLTYQLTRQGVGSRTRWALVAPCRTGHSAGPAVAANICVPGRALGCHQQVSGTMNTVCHHCKRCKAGCS